MTKEELVGVVAKATSDHMAEATHHLMEKIVALESRLQAAENRLNQGDTTNTAPAGQPSAAKDYPY